MRYPKRYFICAIILGSLLLLKFYFSGSSFAHIEKSQSSGPRAEDWNLAIAKSSNQGELVLHIDGREFTNKKNGVYLDANLNMMIPSGLVRDAFDCSAHLYDKGVLLVEKREDTLKFTAGQDHYIKNGIKCKWQSPLIKKGGGYAVSLDVLAQELGYSCQWDAGTNTMAVHSLEADAGSILPSRYDLREKGRAPQVKDQGPYGTCWAFAALTALESSLLPGRAGLLSVDHMNQNNSFTSATKDGGQYTMAMAYLAAWQGPVYEVDDPYGDGKTDASLQPVCHVQDMQIIEPKNLESIKEAVFKYGGVESCIYTTMQGAGGSSSYYNSAEYAYCYAGAQKPNHDVVIIGWDDQFPKGRFSISPQGDGAFLCQNSWGSGFGDGGVFYVSYFDANIGIHNLVYTGVEETDNYDGLYQSDLCGWVGQMGYEQESIYGANVFTVNGQQSAAAAGFYTTDKNTSYQVYIVPEFTGVGSLGSRQLVAEGELAYAGYHTVAFDQPVRLEQGNKFAVVVWLSTPNAARPMAIEYAADEMTQEVDLEDGEGYVSADGRSWADAGKESQCNLCIKVYTRNIQASGSR